MPSVRLLFLPSIHQPFRDFRFSPTSEWAVFPSAGLGFVVDCAEDEDGKDEDDLSARIRQQHSAASMPNEHSDSPPHRTPPDQFLHQFPPQQTGEHHSAPPMPLCGPLANCDVELWSLVDFNALCA